MTIGSLRARRVKGRQPLRPDAVLWKDNSPGSVRAGIKKKNRLAYVSAYLFDNARCEWRKCEGGSGTDAPCQQPLHFGRLCTGENQ